MLAMFRKLKKRYAKRELALKLVRFDKGRYHQSGIPLAI